jgi:hypothetical protein
MNRQVDIRWPQAMPLPRRAFLRTFFGAVVFAALLSTEGTGQEIACIPDQPIMYVGKEVHVSAFAPAPAGAHLQFAWSATGGKIYGSGREITWNFRETLSGVYTSTVTVTRDGQRLGECSAQVTVIEPERGSPPPQAVVAPEPRITARAFLSADMKEEAGYGLYSYLLFGSPPTAETRARYLKALDACLSMISTVSELRQYRPAGKLNVTYIPVKARPSSDPTAEWLLNNYDFARARVLLDLLSPRYRTGPYIVSTLAPLSNLQSIPQDHLFQDMSLVPTEPDDLLSWWIRAFLNQAAQEQFWQPQTGEMLTLKVRTMLSVEAAALPEVKKQLASWIAWAK